MHQVSNFFQVKETLKKKFTHNCVSIFPFEMFTDAVRREAHCIPGNIVISLDANMSCQGCLHNRLYDKDLWKRGYEI